MYLAGDVGGTKTILALYSESRGPRSPVVETIFRSRDYEQFEQIACQFVEDNDRLLVTDPIAVASIGVAGPVDHDAAKVTNLAWTVRRSLVAATLHLRIDHVLLLNDLEATANAVPRLTADDIATVNTGLPMPHAPIAVIAPGTGLGQAYLTWDGVRYRPFPSEGGHVDFAPANQLQLDLLNYLYRRYRHVSYERVASGQGIPHIYEFLRDTGRAAEPADLADAIERAADPTPVIVAAANEYPICHQSLDLFVAILGAKCGNVALAMMARGGIFLGGGIPPRILNSLQSESFMEPFTNKGRFTEMMAQIPVHVITNPKAGLLGAAHAAFLHGEKSQRTVRV
ncbi:MAG: glucokinase [Planctomycetales bacterium]|nr:glucokinase [Planctomycetales bacterium]